MEIRLNTSLLTITIKIFLGKSVFPELQDDDITFYDESDIELDEEMLTTFIEGYTKDKLIITLKSLGPAKSIFIK